MRDQNKRVFRAKVAGRELLPIVPRVARERWAEIKMPRPGEDRSNVGGAAQFQYRTRPAFPLSLPISDPSRFPAPAGRRKTCESFGPCLLHVPVGDRCAIQTGALEIEV